VRQKSKSVSTKKISKKSPKKTRSKKDSFEDFLKAFAEKTQFSGQGQSAWLGPSSQRSNSNETMPPSGEAEIVIPPWIHFS
jgi:hypothetical protein